MITALEPYYFQNILNETDLFSGGILSGVSLRIYFSWLGKDRESRGISESNMVVKSDNFLEKISYVGKFEPTEDETAFKSISPGGYFKYEMNDERVKAESNLKGEIEYTLYDGKNNLVMDEKGKKLLAEAIKEMIAWGMIMRREEWKGFIKKKE